MTNPENDRRVCPFGEIEARWQQRWDDAKVFEASVEPGDPKWYVMELPPFANGTLHLGHVRNYAIADASARFHRQLGARVLYTTGFDTHGLPNEIAARDAGCRPKALADATVVTMTAQFRRLGLSHDTRRITDYGDPRFYRWVQWVFARLLEGGFAYRARRDVSWCAGCESSVEDGLIADDLGCWRCGGTLEVRPLSQWFVRETVWAESVLAGLDGLDRWPEAVKAVQARYVGRVEGLTARLRIEGYDVEVEVFADRPELLADADRLEVAPDHPLIGLLRDAGALPADVAQQVTELGRTQPRGFDREVRRDTYAHRATVALGVGAAHPLGGPPLPVVVVSPWTGEVGLAAFGAGAGDPSGPELDPPERPVTAAVEPVVRYRMGDWPFSRQRYWGAPVPVVHCDRCGPLPVPDSELPVLLPLDVDLSAGGNPLVGRDDFVATTCPSCRGAARRDTETLGAYSSPWWYLWSAKAPDAEDPFADGEARLWQPVDLMVGGVEQSTTCFFHARTMARSLTALGVVDREEPIDEVLAIGMVRAAGRKMSKSAGNSVGVVDLLDRYGADAVRLAVLAAASPTSDFEWSTASVARERAWLTAVWRFVTEREGELAAAAGAGGGGGGGDGSSKLRRSLAGWVGTAVAKATAGMHRNAFHLVAKDLRFLFDRLQQFDTAARRRSDHLAADDGRALAVGVRALVQMLAPLAPHLAEELWRTLGEQDLLAAGGWPAAGGAAQPDGAGIRPSAR